MDVKLYATPLSHFSRKVRVLMDLYSIPYQFVDVGNVAEVEKNKFGENPVMKVPVLVDEDNWVIESDHIANYLVQKYDETDRFQVQIKKVFDLNVRAVMNGVMTEEVKFILGERTGVPTKNYVFFNKALEAITNGLSWLEDNASHFDADSFKYKEIHLVCLWDHLSYYNLVPMKYKKLEKIVREVSKVPLVKQSSPEILKPRS